MVLPKPEPIQVARALLSAERHGAQFAAKKFDVSKRTITRWRQEHLGENSDPNSPVKSLIFDLRVAHSENINSELSVLIVQLKNRLSEAIENLDPKALDTPSFLLEAIATLTGALNDRATIAKMADRNQKQKR